MSMGSIHESLGSFGNEIVWSCFRWEDQTRPCTSCRWPQPGDYRPEGRCFFECLNKEEAQGAQDMLKLVHSESCLGLRRCHRCEEHQRAASTKRVPSTADWGGHELAGLTRATCDANRRFQIGSLFKHRKRSTKRSTTISISVLHWPNFKVRFSLYVPSFAASWILSARRPRWTHQRLKRANLYLGSPNECGCCSTRLFPFQELLLRHEQWRMLTHPCTGPTFSHAIYNAADER